MARIQHEASVSPVGSSLYSKELNIMVHVKNHWTVICLDQSQGLCLFVKKRMSGSLRAICKSEYFANARRHFLLDAAHMINQKWS